MKLLFTYNQQKVRRYLLSLKIQKNAHLLHELLADKKHEEEIYILDCLEHSREIDFNKISERAIQQVMAAVSYLEEDSNFPINLDSKTLLEIIMIAEKSLDTDLSCFYTSQLYLMEIFMRMYRLGISVKDYYPTYLEQDNFEEYDCEESFKSWGDDLIQDMKLHHVEVDSDDQDTLIKYSDLFHISMDEINRIIENAWSPIGEMLSNIKIADQSFFHSIQNQFDIRMLYQAEEEKLYLFYDDDTYFPAIKRIEMLLRIFEEIQLTKNIAS
ncbi:MULTISPECIES: hypothetical protein [Bacillus cereus group]|uniref:Uncharacterized protein n=3 Tax=Bacillus cereus group TaxID=86661 RepID=A1BZ67_BACCE|nr:MULTISPECIES: hypothetical protein [Bacillus cereus group]ABK00831.1 hypothetical protein pPER272_AH820_0037 [Bacillus cereus]ABK01096.1 hypothetical protein pPER272_0037 [Bacillus cereus]ACK92717.1 conserved hypothetical protein [Bacillus cereus AH820]MBL3758007.1 hypothetical protein [Bacillus cereus]SME24314.1 hypothetical protein BACERE00221_03489 [Bacillus paranthracis]